MLSTKLNAFFLFLFLCFSLQAQDTFSIVAVDPETGEVGGAGASCIDDGDCGGCGGVIIINDLIPGRGGMNSQAYACIPNINLSNGLIRLEEGDSPQEALDYVLANDACSAGNFNSAFRQYGIVDIKPDDGTPRAVAFTGASCDPYANHIVGANYAIQGNILLGPEILEGMETNFLNTEGSLAVKLMAALQGANVPGADTRCLEEGVSSLSAFLRVAKPTDTDGNFWLELNVKETGFGVEPIDSLQVLFDEIISPVGLFDINENNVSVEVFPNPAKDNIQFSFLEFDRFPNAKLLIFNTLGQSIFTKDIKEKHTLIQIEALQKERICFYKLIDRKGKTLANGKFVLQ